MPIVWILEIFSLRISQASSTVDAGSRAQHRGYIESACPRRKGIKPVSGDIQDAAQDHDSP